MPMLKGSIIVEELLDLLCVGDVGPECRLSAGDEVTIDVDQAEIDSEATPEEPDVVHVDAEIRDLRDGIRALVAGDFAMASILLIRAFDGAESGVQLVVEEECRAAGRKQAA